MKKPRSAILPAVDLFLSATRIHPFRKLKPIASKAPRMTTITTPKEFKILGLTKMIVKTMAAMMMM